MSASQLNERLDHFSLKMELTTKVLDKLFDHVKALQEQTNAQAKFIEELFNLMRTQSDSLENRLAIMQKWLQSLTDNAAAEPWKASLYGDDDEGGECDCGECDDESGEGFGGGERLGPSIN